MEEAGARLLQILEDSSDVKKAIFTNEYGEKFTIYNTGITIYMVGDETDHELVNLFSSNFDIWSKDELKKLGEAIAKTSV